MIRLADIDRAMTDAVDTAVRAAIASMGGIQAIKASGQPFFGLNEWDRKQIMEARQ
ncbi:MAG: hypothetical protein MJH10_10230 [Epibacterium sp.]|nr:hypothetical protein [Epibacterium sp.]NQX73916.1 hypothetical protein [Epibacterium sp.]